MNGPPCAEEFRDIQNILVIQD
jgi:hypothetical protein